MITILDALSLERKAKDEVPFAFLKRVHDTNILNLLIHLSRKSKFLLQLYPPLNDLQICLRKLPKFSSTSPHAQYLVKWCGRAPSALTAQAGQV